MPRPEDIAGVADVDLSGRTVLVTGATSGVGRETALALGRLGATVLVHGRDRDRGEAVAREIGDATFHPADFASLDAVRDLGDAVSDRVATLDTLVNAAGASFSRGRLTADGFERTVAINHLAPFLLTNELRPTLAPDGRVVTVASEVHRRADADDLRAERFTTVDRYDGLRAYGRSKLANVLFARALADRGVHSNSLHPGFVPGTRLWREAGFSARVTMGVLAVVPEFVTRRFAETPETAARTPVYLAAGSVGGTGRYFADCEPVEPSPVARDDDLAEQLWETSAELVS